MTCSLKSHFLLEPWRVGTNLRPSSHSFVQVRLCGPSVRLASAKSSCAHPSRDRPRIQLATGTAISARSTTLFFDIDNGCCSWDPRIEDSAICHPAGCLPLEKGLKSRSPNRRVRGRHGFRFRMVAARQSREIDWLHQSRRDARAIRRPKSAWPYLDLPC